MRGIPWKKFAWLALSGSILLQIPNCFQVISAISNAITAGSVIFLVRKVVD
jgi:hypothetical protein